MPGVCTEIPPAIQGATVTAINPIILFILPVERGQWGTVASPVHPINTSNTPGLPGNSQAAQVALCLIFVQCTWPLLFNKSEFITQLSAKSGGIPLHGSALRKYKYTISNAGLPPIEPLALEKWNHSLVWLGMDLQSIQFHLQGHLPLLQAAPSSTQPGQLCLECKLKTDTGAVNHQTTCKKFT